MANILVEPISLTGTGRQLLSVNEVNGDGTEVSRGRGSGIVLVFQKWVWMMKGKTRKDIQRSMLTRVDSEYLEKGRKIGNLLNIFSLLSCAKLLAVRGSERHTFF